MEVPLEAPVPGIVRAIAAAVGDVVDEGAHAGRARAGRGARRAAARPRRHPTRACRAPTCRRCSTAARCSTTRRAPRRWRGAMRRAGAARARTSPTCSTPAACSSTARFAVAAQRSRRSLDDLQRNTPADGLITGTGSVNAALFGAERSRVAVMAYDYTVLAGTQGYFNHRKSDRLLEIADAQRAAAGAVCRRRRRPAGRCRFDHHRRAALHHLPALRAAVRPGAGGGHRARPLLRRQCRAAGLLRRDHRHRQRQHRHGRAGDDRRRRPGPRARRRGRPGQRAGRPTA